MLSLSMLASLAGTVHAAVLGDAAVNDASAWRDMFVLTLPWAEKFLRPIFVYFFLIVGLRVSGKRELAQLNPFDLIVLLMLSNTVQNAIIGDDNTVTGGFIGASTLLVLNYAVIRVVRRHKRLQALLEGRPDVLIRHGKVMDGHLDQEMMSRSDLAAAAHKQGIASLKDVERCVLEPTGTISFIEREPTHDAQRHQELIEMLGQLREDLSLLRAHRATQPSSSGAGDEGALHAAERAVEVAVHAAAADGNGSAAGRRVTTE